MLGSQQELVNHMIPSLHATVLIPQVSLRENSSLPCVKIFAVRFLSGAQQRGSLSCVSSIAQGEKTFGKKIVCRAFFPQRTTKK
jgi:hypothetical protein